jgi:hypothetical protein
MTAPPSSIRGRTRPFAIYAFPRDWSFLGPKVCLTEPAPTVKASLAAKTPNSEHFCLATLAVGTAHLLNLHSCKVAAIDAAHLAADMRTDKELDLYCESCELASNCDILLTGTQGFRVFFMNFNFVLDKYPI